MYGCDSSDLSKLPDVRDLMRLMQSLAILDAILSPEWDYRYSSFNSRWADGEQMGSSPFYAHRPLTEAMSRALNPEADWGQVRADAVEICYPLAEPES